MKNETINFILICVAYFSIGLILAGNYVQDKTLKMVTEKQFSNLQDRVKELEDDGSRRIANIRK
jgi:hypothetical protein